MSIIAYVGAGQMASALSFPVTENGHTVRLVGTHLDREIIDSAKKTGFHPTLKRQLPESNMEYFQIKFRCRLVFKPRHSGNTRSYASSLSYQRNGGPS